MLAKFSTLCQAQTFRTLSSATAETSGNLLNLTAKLTDCTIAVRSPQSNSLRNQSGDLAPLPIILNHKWRHRRLLPALVRSHPSTNSGIHSSKTPPHTLPRHIPPPHPAPFISATMHPHQLPPRQAQPLHSRAAPPNVPNTSRHRASAPRSRCCRPHSPPSHQHQQHQQ